MSYSSLWCCVLTKIPEKTKGKICFFSWFQRAQSMFAWLHVSGPIVKQEIMGVGVGGRSIFASWKTGSRAKREDLKGARQDITPKEMPPVSYFLLSTTSQ
jgi:hypothetical protein